MKPDAIVVLAAGITRNATGRIVSTDLTIEDNERGAPGGKLRVLATAVLALKYSESGIVASGGFGRHLPSDIGEHVLLCDVLRDELVAAGVAGERIALESTSNTTYEQLKALTDYVIEMQWSRTFVVTNRWHVPRTRTMLVHFFPEIVKRIEIIAAEDVLIASGASAWQSVIADAYASKWLAQRIEKEERGIADILSGTYQIT